MVPDENPVHIESFGYDSFIGRAVSDKGTESFVDLDLKTLGTLHLQYMRQVVVWLCKEVKRGEKVLLARSPGYIERYMTFGEDPLDMIAKEIGGKDIEVRTDFGEVVGQRFEVLTPGQMKDLERKYELIEEMKGFPNPFLYQP